jgi:uncharacterized membrane protein
MQRLTVWRFDCPSGAEDAVKTLQSLTQQDLITVHDAAVVSWEASKRKPKTRQLHDVAGAGALGGAFWGHEQEKALREAFAE